MKETRKVKMKSIFSLKLAGILMQHGFILVDMRENDNCSGKYVVRTYAGDLFYRLYNGSNRQKEKEKKKFENMGLFCNPWATYGDDVRDFICLNCATRWNKKNEKIVNDQL